MIKHYYSSQYDKILHQEVDHKVSSFDEVIQIEKSQTFQTIIGFGGAFTEAAAFTLSKMSKKNRQEVIERYFSSSNGLHYTIGRMPMNSCDFALGNYDYVDAFDESLESFDITREKQLVIPLIKDAERVLGKQIPLLISPWSPPKWMKTNGEMNNGGRLLKKYYPTWAMYFVKFIDALKKEGLLVQYVTVQNEPAAKQTWDSCIYTAEEERDFVKFHLGPLLKKHHPEVNILIWDHNRDIIVERADTVLKDNDARDYVWGTGYHWYVSEAFENLSTLHQLHPDKHILFTEGCIEGGVHLNDWTTGERYARNMIGDFNHFSEGYIDWNLTLNEMGGPNHVGNYCDAPIICDTLIDKIYINSSYTYMKHFSKHVVPGSIRIASKSTHQDLLQVAFLTPSGKEVLIVLNQTEKPYVVKLTFGDLDYKTEIKPRSISTFVKEN